MPNRPHVVCLMSASLDGGLHASRYTTSPDGNVKDWSGLYEARHGELGGDAWLVGRTTMAEMAKGEPKAPREVGAVARPVHVAEGAAKPFAIAVDTHGALHFRDGAVDGDRALVLLGGSVSDAHLAALAADGVSYVVAEGEAIDLAAALAVLRRDFGVERLLLEGGAAIVGSFLAAGLVDELELILAPALDGREDAERFVAFGTEGLQGKVRLSLTDCARLDHGAVLLRYDVAAGA